MVWPDRIEPQRVGKREGGDLWAGRGEASAHWKAWRGHRREAGLHVGALTWPKLRFREERGLSVGLEGLTEFTPPFQKLVLGAQNFS